MISQLHNQLIVLHHIMIVQLIPNIIMTNIYWLRLNTIMINNNWLIPNWSTWLIVLHPHLFQSMRSVFCDSCAVRMSHTCRSCTCTRQVITETAIQRFSQCPTGNSIRDASGWEFPTNLTSADGFPYKSNDQFTVSLEKIMINSQFPCKNS